MPVKAGVRLTSLVTAQLNADKGVIDHVVNQTGSATVPPNNVINLKQFPE